MSDETAGVADDGADDPQRCSFCGRDPYQLRKLVAGPNVYICADCVEVCADIISDDRGMEGALGCRASLIGSVVTARCPLCKTPSPASQLVTVPTRGAVCEACLREIAVVLRERGAS
jgi:hypothetical protein